MKAEYNLSKMKSRKNPYARKLKKQITLPLNPKTLDDYKPKSSENGIPYKP